MQKKLFMNRKIVYKGDVTKRQKLCEVVESGFVLT